MAIRQYARDDDQADDFLQDCWIRILEQLDSYSPGSPFAGWAIAVSKNVCRMKLREERRAGVEVTFGTVEDELTTLPDPGEMPRAPPDSRQRLWKRAVYQALGRLPDRERDTIVLRLLEGKDTAATAGILGVSESAVRSILLRGMTRLRRMEDLRRLLPDWIGWD